VLEEILMPLGWNPQKLLKDPIQQILTPPEGTNPASPPGARSRTPMQNRNAQQGAQQGGATNNPQGQSGRPDSGQAAALLQQLVQRLRTQG